MADSTIFQLLEHDHREVEGLFRELKSAKGGRGGPAEATFGKLTRELQRHMMAEEKSFYETLGKAPDGKELVAEGLKEHREAREMIAAMSGAPGDAVWLQKVRALEQAIQHHVQEEEGQMFPTARKVIGREQATKLGAEFEAQKKA